MTFDVAFVGNYTKDMIVTPSGVRLVDGGGFNYGAHVAAMMGLRVAAVTRLAFEDRRVVERLEAIGVTVFPCYTPQSTCLVLEYPTADPDYRIIRVSASAGSFTVDQVAGLAARVFLVNPSFRGEVGLDVLGEIKKKGALLAADVQGFLRTVTEQGTLAPAPWPEKAEVLAMLDILKADAVEAAALTGESDLAWAARRLAAWGPREVVLTNREGVLVLADGRVYAYHFKPRALVGRSGRGDTCIAAYVCARMDEPPERAARWAAAVTTLKLEVEGPLCGTRQQVEELLARSYRL